MSLALPSDLGPARDDERRLRRLLDDSEASRLAGRHATGAEQARDAAALAGRLGSREPRARALRLLATHEFRLGENEECIGTLDEAVGLLEELDDPSQLSSALNTKTMAYCELGLHEEALECAARSLDAAKLSGDRLTIAWAYNRAGVANGALGDEAKCVASLRFALDLARDVGDDECLFSVLNNLLDSCTALAQRQLDAGELGEFRQTLAGGLAHADEALTLARASGNAHREAIVLLNYGDALAVAGEHERALDLFHASEGISRGEGFRPLAHGARHGIARILMARGEVREAIESYRALLLEGEAVGDGPVQLQLHLTLSRAHKRLGRYREALEHHECYHALERRLHSQVAETRARLLANRLELDHARLEAERASLEGALQRLRNRELEAEKLALEQEAALLVRRAHEDGLTGLWNRRYVERELPRLLGDARRRGEPLSVALIDADRFKSINDCFGHLVGDEVLRRLATMLLASVRPSDLVARVGGEEFLVVLPGASAIAATTLSERLCASVRGGDCDDLPPGCGPTVSVGVAVLDVHELPMSGDETAAVTELLARADAALYSAKSNGRDRVEIAAPG